MRRLSARELLAPGVLPDSEWSSPGDRESYREPYRERDRGTVADRQPDATAVSDPGANPSADPERGTVAEPNRRDGLRLHLPAAPCIHHDLAGIRE